MILLILFYLNSVINEPLSLCDFDRKEPHILQFGTNIPPSLLSDAFCHYKNEKKKKCKTRSSVLKLQTKFIKETCRPELSGIFLIPKNLIGSTNELLLGCTSITFLQKVKIFFPVLFVCLNVFSLCLLIPIQCFKQEQVYSFKFA